MRFFARNFRDLRLQDWIFHAYVILCTVVVWSFAVFPTQDGPAILTTVSLLHKLQNPECTQVLDLFRVNPYPIPNWISHAILYVLTFHLQPETAEKICISLYIILFAYGYRYFLYSLARSPYLGGLLVAPLIMNGFVIYGFYNFLFSVAILWWCLGYWLRHRKRAYTLLVMTFGYTLLYFSHPFGWGAMALFQAIYISYPIMRQMLRRSFQRIFKRSLLRVFVKQAFDALICFLPSLVLFIGYFLIPKLGSPSFVEASNGEDTVLYSILYKILSFFVGSTFSTYQKEFLPIAVGLGILLVFIYVVTIPLCKKPVERKVLAFCHGAVAAIMLSPFSFAGGWHIQERLVFIFFVLVLTVVSLRLIHRTAKYTPLIICPILMVQLACIYKGSAEYQTALSEFTKISPYIQNSRIVAHYFKTDFSSEDNKVSLRAMGIHFTPRYNIVYQSFERLFYGRGSCVANLASFQAGEPYIFPVVQKNTLGMRQLRANSKKYNESLIMPSSLGLSKTPPDTLLSWNYAVESVDNFKDAIVPNYTLVYASSNDAIHVYRLKKEPSSTLQK